jgi:hypothetical protein
VGVKNEMPSECQQITKWSCEKALTWMVIWTRPSEMAVNNTTGLPRPFIAFLISNASRPSVTATRSFFTRETAVAFSSGVNQRAWTSWSAKSTRPNRAYLQSPVDPS